MKLNKLIFLVSSTSLIYTTALYSHTVPGENGGHVHHHYSLKMSPEQQEYYKKVTSDTLDFLEQFRDKKKNEKYKEFLSRMKGTLIFSYDHPYRNREFCNAFALCRDDYVGIKLANMNEAQRGEFQELMETLLAPYGYEKMIKVFERQPIIADLEQASRDNPTKYPTVGGPPGSGLETWAPTDKKGNPIPRKSDDYYIAFFGNLENFMNGNLTVNEGFGIRVEGHHLSLNFTFINSNGNLIISSSPTFYGSNPMIVPPAPESTPEKYQHWKLKVDDAFMLSETQIAKLLIKSLTEQEKKAALYPHMGTPLFEDAAKQKPIESENFKKYSTGELGGLSFSSLKGSEEEVRQQKYLLTEFLKLVSATQRKEVLNLQDMLSDINNMRVAYYGGTEKFDEFYFRIQSKQFLIELVQSSNFGVINPGDINNKNDPKNNELYNNNHVHIMFRDLRNDWGYDPLQLHEKFDHAHAKKNSKIL